MELTLDAFLQQAPLFRKMSADDRRRLAAVSRLRHFERGQDVLREGEPSDLFYVVASGRVKVYKTTRAGKDVILEIFGPGDLLGAVAVYEGRPYPASAVALEPTACFVVPRQALFSLLEQYPTLVRGLLLGLTQRLVELTNRLAELTGGRVESRFARVFLKLASSMGRPDQDGIRIPMPLTRQELADMTGTTIETCIRIMSRWGKQDLVRTDKDGFVICDRGELETLANG